MTEATPREVGLVAGGGRYPLLLAEEARRHGVTRLVIEGMHGGTDPAIEKLANEMHWLYVGQVGKAIETFRRAGISQVIFAGQVKPGRLFQGLRPDLRALKILATAGAKNAETIFGGVVAEFEREGLKVLPCITFMENYLAAEGVMGKVKPGSAQRDDIELGRRLAREVSRLEIGQTVVVKGGAVLAVEAFEGTDQAILRAGELSHGDLTVVKVAKPKHDIRFDVPCVGMKTVESLKTAGAKALALQAGLTLLVDKDEFIPALDAAKIALVGFSLDAPDHGAA